MDPASPELFALLAACRARPADDLPRLVLADWLDENGDSDRAEFVRVQVELSHPTADARRRNELRNREAELLREQRRRWVGGLDRVYDRLRPDEAWSFSRGLLVMREMTAHVTHPAFHEWVGSSEADWLGQVDLTYRSADDFVKADLPDPLFGRVNLTLDLTGTPDGMLRTQCRQLVVSSNFTAVHQLKVQAPALPVAHELTRAEVGRLNRLHLPVEKKETRSRDVTRLAEVLASAPFISLSSLDIGQLTEPALRALIRSPYLGNLTELDLIGSPIGDAGMVALCGSKLAHTLRAVEFPNTGIGDAGAIALARSPLFAHLHGPRLNLMMNRIGDAGLTALAESEHLLRFSELVLRENYDKETPGSGIGDVGVEALAASPYAANLQYLDFWRNRITDRGAFALARSPHLNSVADLSVKENAVTAAGAAALHERFGEAAKT